VAHHPAEVQRIYADRAWHGRGVGSALLKACVEQSRAWACDVLWLGVWEQNPRGIAFYEKWGFRRVGAQRFLVGTDSQRDHVMALGLA
jgi:GNAT superfamily N-acetyltransferase